MFFFNDTATTEIYTLSLHDALPISLLLSSQERVSGSVHVLLRTGSLFVEGVESPYSLMAASKGVYGEAAGDRKSTRLNSSHANISYAVFCLKKKNKYTFVLSSNQ